MHTLNARPAVYTVWLCWALATVPLFMMSPKELAPTEDQGVVFGIVDAAANATLDQTSRNAAAANDVFMSMPETEFTFQVTSPIGFRRYGGGPLGRTRAVGFRYSAGSPAGIDQIPGIRMFAVTPPPLPGGGQFPVEFVLAATEEPDNILRFAQQLQLKAIQSGMFAFPPIIDVKIDQPQAQIVIDRDKVADLGLDLQQVGGDLASLVGGDFVNRFNIAGRSYKVIPQIQRVDRLTAEQLNNVYVTGPAGELVPLGTIARVENRTVPRSINRFQQFNAVKLSGVALRPLNEALAFLEEEAAKSCPRAIWSTTPVSRDSCARGQQISAGLHAGPGDDLPHPGGAIQQLPRSVRHSGRVSAPGHVRRTVFTFLKMPDPSVPFWTAGWTTTLNIYSQVGLVTLVGVVSKNGILIVEFANKLQMQGKQAGGSSRSVAHPPASHLDDQQRHYRGILSPGAGHRCRGPGQEFHRSGAGGRHGHRHAVHPVRDPVHLYAGGPRPLQGRIGCHGSKGGNGPEIDQSADNLIPYGLKTNLPA
jgi:multidrug efflux pump